MKFDTDDLLGVRDVNVMGVRLLILTFSNDSRLIRCIDSENAENILPAEKYTDLDRILTLLTENEIPKVLAPGSDIYENYDILPTCLKDVLAPLDGLLHNLQQYVDDLESHYIDIEDKETQVTELLDWYEKLHAVQRKLGVKPIKVGTAYDVEKYSRLW